MNPAQLVAIRNDHANGMALLAIAARYEGVTLQDVERVIGAIAPTEPKPVKTKPEKTRTHVGGYRRPTPVKLAEARNDELRRATRMELEQRQERFRLIAANYFCG